MPVGLLEQALARRALLEESARGDVLASPQSVRDYLRLALAARPYEVFVGLYLDSQNRVLGVEEVLFLGHPDGTLQPTLALRRDVVRVIRQVGPEAVLCPDPTRRFGAAYINHPDHRAIGEVALDAVYPSARDPLVFPELVEEGLEPHKVVQVFLSNPSEPTCLVDISTTLERKIEALRQHRSQITYDRLREFIPRRAAEVGEPHGLAAAEAFALIRLG